MATEFIARNGLIVISGQIQGLLASGIVLSGSIASGQVSNFKLSSGSIIYNIQSGSISSGLLADNSIVSGSIASGQIGQMHLSSGAINSGQLANNSIVSGSIASGQVSNFHLSSGAAIYNIQSGSLASGLLANNSVVSGSIASGQIGQMHLSSGAVNSGQLANNSVVSGSIASGQVSNFHLSSGAAVFNLSGGISSGLIGNNSVVSGSIASGQLGRFHLSSGAINSGQLANNSVVSGSIASGQVSNFHLSSGAAIFNLQSGSIRSGLLANNSIVSGSIASGQIGQMHLSSGLLNSGQLANNSVVSVNIASGQVSNFHLSSGAAIFNLQSGSIGSGLLANNSIVSGSIASGQIGRMHLSSGSINSGYLSMIGGIAGYFGGGSTNSPVTTADKLVYANDTTAAQTTANLSQARQYLAGISEGLTKGYFAGGFTLSTQVATADKLVYANDTTAAQTTANLSQARDSLAGCSGEGTKGYFAGGYSSSYATTADKITYSNDTTSAQTTANLSQARLGLAGCSGEGTKGYFAGGMTGLANVTVTTADKITYSNDTTTAQTTGNLSQARYYLTGCSGENTKGYFAGGISSNLGLGVVTSDKITYTSDTTAAQTSANLSQARGYLAGVTEGSQKGYFAGGNSSGNQVTAEKLTYSNDTTSAQASANLSQARYGLAGVDGIIKVYAPVLSGSIASGQIGQYHLSSGCIFSGHIASGAVFGSVIGSGGISSGDIQLNQIGFNHFGREITNNTAKKNNFRISVVSGVPITSGDLTSQATLYLVPYNGDTISLYDGTNWGLFTTSGTSVSLATSTVTSGTVYDVYCYNNAGVPALELSTVWTNTNTRADAIQYINGVPVKSGTTTRRVVGTVYATGSGVVSDGRQYRGVWNWDNRVTRPMDFTEATAQTYNVSGSLNSRPWNNISGNAIYWIQGFPGLATDAVGVSNFRKAAGAASAYANINFISNAGLSNSPLYSSATANENRISAFTLQCINGLNWVYPQTTMTLSGTFGASQIWLYNNIEA